MSTSRGEGEDEKDPQQPTVVIDTVGFVRALINPFGVWGAIIFDFSDTYEHLVSLPLLAEIDDVLQWPQLRRKLSRLAGRDEEAVRARVAQGRFMVLSEIPSVTRDPDDDHLLALAKEGEASLIVTEDKDLLSMGGHEGILHITGASFIALLRAQRMPQDKS